MGETSDLINLFPSSFSIPPITYSWSNLCFIISNVSHMLLCKDSMLVYAIFSSILPVIVVLIIILGVSPIFGWSYSRPIWWKTCDQRAKNFYYGLNIAASFIALVLFMIFAVRFWLLV